MSSRRRKSAPKQRKSADRSIGPLLSTDQQCDCPQCTGQQEDPEAFFDALLSDVDDLADLDDPVDAEIIGAALHAMVREAGAELGLAVLDTLIEQAAMRPSRNGLALLRAVSSVTTPAEAAEMVTAAADRIAAGGVPDLPWVAELREPVVADGCLRIADASGMVSLLSALFRRAGRAHSLVMLVTGLSGTANIWIGDEGGGAAFGQAVIDEARAEGRQMQKTSLTPAEFRWYAEAALDERMAFDGGELDLLNGADEDEDEDELPFPVQVAFTRARLAALPAARRPVGAARQPAPSPQALFEALGLAAPGLRPVPERPAKRRKKDGPAPTYQIKVSLRGAKPPIWRRLLVPGDLTLAQLHDVIQVAFGWGGGHLHVFETPAGDFGQPDPGLGHRADTSATLEQVAPDTRDKISYTYDFGDDWEHQIVVEKLLAPDPSAPRCTGGRRAAPMDDCGGIWGYEELIEILAHPEHPEHAEQLEWLGLDDASQFDPAAFDLAEVNAALRH